MAIWQFGFHSWEQKVFLHCGSLPQLALRGCRPHPVSPSGDTERAHGKKKKTPVIGRGRRTRCWTAHNECFPSCSSITHPMIHFTDTWVIIGLSSSPRGWSCTSKARVYKAGVAQEVSHEGGGRDWVKTRRRGRRESRWSGRRGGKFNWQLVWDGLVQEENIHR